MRTALLVLLGLLLPASSRAELRIERHVAYLFPEVPSARDSRYIGYLDQCGGSAPETAPVLRNDPDRGRVLDLRFGSGELCFPTSPSFASTLHLVRLPPTWVNTVVIVRVHDSLPPGRVGEKVIGVYTANGLPPSVAGPWYNPARSGQGLYFGKSTRGMVVAWTTFDPDGRPLWLSGIQDSGASPDTFTARFPLSSVRGGAFPSKPQTQAPNVAYWGELTVEYLACGRLRATWNANDDAYPPGSMELRHAVLDATHYCEMDQWGRDNEISVRYYDPVIEGANE